MRAIVTGSRSFIGAAVIECLRSDGVEVTALRHSFEEEPEKLPGEADLWIHFAWAGQGPGGRVDGSIQTYNMEMSMAALRKASELQVKRFVFAGSQAEYGPVRRKTAIAETALCRPVSEYGKAKKAFGEFAGRWVMAFNEDDDFGDHGSICEDHSEAADKNPSGAEEACGLEPSGGRMSFLHLRIFSVYGGGDRKDSLISSAIDTFRRGEEMELSPCTQLWNYMYIKDAARAIALVSLLPWDSFGECESLNIAGEDTRPLRSYIEELRELMGSSSKLSFGARSFNTEGAADLWPDTSKLRGLGFREEYSFSGGIKEMLDAVDKE